jgi:transposase InsO family protein
MVVPDYDELKIKLLRHIHDSPVGGYPGRSRTLDLLSRHYYWLKMYEHVRRFVSSYYTCSRLKSWRTAYSRVLKPLPVPQRRWKDILMDFVVELPESNGCTNILVVVDRLSKMRHFIECPDITAPTVSRLFLRHIWKLHGLPNSIISDRGSTFVSTFWKELYARLRIDSRLSTSFYPETNGQTERINREIEQYLRSFISY